MLEISTERLFLALARAEDRVSRLDERLRACPFAAGFVARLDFAEAAAWGWRSGEIAPLEDLLLHDEEMDMRAPDQALRSAYGLIRARRKAAIAGPGLFSPQGAQWLAGRRDRPPAEPAAGSTKAEPASVEDWDCPDLLSRVIAPLERLGRGETGAADADLADWLALLTPMPATPALLQAAVALEGWRIVDPLPRATYVGGVMVGAWLRAAGRVQGHLLGVESGWRAQSRRVHDARAAPMAARLTYWLGLMAAAADHGLEELHRLELARQVLAVHIGARRAHARFGDLARLLLDRPLVTAPMIAARLKITPQSARRLIGGLGASVVEVSGRSRFRAWRV